MKSLWKCLVRSACVVGLGAGLAAPLFAQDDGPAGIVRISQPSTRDLTNGRILPVSSMQVNGNCMNSNGGSCPSGKCDPSSVGVSGDMMGTCDQNCQRGFRKYRRQDWRTSDWQPYGYGGFHARTRAHSLAMERGLFNATGYTPSTYYHDPSGQPMLDYLSCKFGYFIPTGGGGQGLPWVGHYSRVYPVNPSYSDPRDGQAYAAQGYGVPMAVPLAPVVGHTYDYGWGVPSSRLTPVSHPAY